jgi:hypothetical protein
MVGEDVEDHRGAIDDRHVERCLQVALLARRQLVVAGDDVRARALDLGPKIGQLAAPEVAIRVGLVTHLDQLARGCDPGGAQQLLELGERVLTLARRARQRGDRQRTLARPRVAQACEVSVSLLGRWRHATDCR